jgi:hypothetical protein
MTAPPVMSPRTNGGWSRESLSTLVVNPWVRSTMMEKIIVVAPTTAVPMSTGLAVALKVLPAPSFSSSRCLARSKSTVKPYCCRICSRTPGVCSITDSSKTDWALSVTGP